MISLTDNAVKHLRILLDEQETGKTGLRIFVEHGGCSGLQYVMEFDAPHDGDEINEREGVAVYIDAQSRAHLQGSILDYHDDLTGAGFRLQNPNAKRTCGCGTSFEPEAAVAAASH
jgi:iron-sulfur cluster assembly protein